MSATLQNVESQPDFFDVTKVPSSALFPQSRPLHWLDVARPIYRFVAHPLTMALVWGVVFILSALISYGWLMVVLL